ncbi:D-xylose-binding periplasmic protein precursor [Ruminiclostridium hungatei]|uniref:D-xylose-binding periplasmic protein n=1 Tax=Ruminiclostridium hungatei TaxID=48256 RepID=A0A1V4SPG6_RUMHU|nr:substrate-binding domain-containing protein [Ruminiclostridium hungatei]OPX45724.1 D-xylose-binding periplasmic protein precursor [Ruminiclostridium hungatei]
MKKSVRIAAMALAGIMSISLFAGCGANNSSGSSASNSSTATSSPAKDKKIKIGLSLPTQQEERWVRDKATMEEAAKKAGVEIAVQVANMDAAKQDSQVENLISQGIDVLILAPHDAKAAASTVDKAHKAGIKVIAYDRLVMGTDVDVYLSFDNVKVGELQGKWLTEHLDKGNIVWLAGSPTDNNATLFKQGAAKYLQPKIDSGDYKVVMEQPVVDWKPDNALKLMENALTANNNNVQGVLAPNDGTAGGCIQALAAQGLAGKVPITGQDSELSAAKRIVEGTQGMTVFKDTRKLGEAAIDAAIKMAKGEDPGADQKVNNEKMDVPSILLAAEAVDKTNIDKILIDSGYLKKEDVYSK